MRILVVVHGFPPTHSAGAERRAERMASWFVRNQHHVEVFTVESVSAREFQVETQEQDGFLVHRVFYDVHDDQDPLLRLYDYPPITEALEDVLARGSFDVVHIVSGYLVGQQAVEAAKRFGLPVVITLTEFWFMCARLNLIQATQTLCSGPDSYDKCARCLMEYKRRYRLPAVLAPTIMDAFWPIMHRASVSGRMRDSVQRRDEILRSTLDNVDLVICPSRYLIHKFGEFGFNTDRFHFIRQGLARPNYSRSSRSQPDVLSLGYIGQIKHHKGVDLLIDAVLPLIQAGEPLILEIWGSEQESPDYTRMLKQRSSRYQANIRWHGRYTGNKVWDVLSEIDVLVVPSRWYENSPNVILEAYEMGIPVIATDLGGMSELVLHEQSGLLFEIDNVSDLRGQINRLLHQPNLLNQLRSGVPNVKTIDEEMAEIVAEYKKLLLDAENV